jgi:hypothetical protein
MRFPISRVSKANALRLCLFALAAFAPIGATHGAAAAPSIYADRAAVEQVYFRHRLGSQPPFDQAMPAALIKRLVDQDEHKEIILQRRYGVQVTGAMVDTEVQRINHTSQAPDVLAEIKASLNDDQSRFARSVVRPLVVERELRARFDRDFEIHKAQRIEALTLHQRLATARANGASPSELLTILQENHTNDISQSEWFHGPRQTNAVSPPKIDLADVQRRFGAGAQVLSSGAPDDGKFYFDDLPAELHAILQIQFRNAGDVSEVMETPVGLLLYFMIQNNSRSMRVAVLALPKKSYEQWIEQQVSNPSAVAQAAGSKLGTN